MTKDQDTLRRAYDTWCAASDFRSRRERLKRFTYGDQWGDHVDDGHGHSIVEGQLLLNSGRRPVTNNLIRQLVKVVVGRYRNIAAEGGVYDSDTGSIDSLNSMPEPLKNL